jgi:hypothetical protein
MSKVKTIIVQGTVIVLATVAGAVGAFAVMTNGGDTVITKTELQQSPLPEVLPVIKDAPCSIVARVEEDSDEVYIGWASNVSNQGYVFERSALTGDSYHESVGIPGWFRATKTSGSHTFVLQILKDNETQECSTTYQIP